MLVFLVKSFQGRSLGIVCMYLCACAHHCLFSIFVKKIVCIAWKGLKLTFDIRVRLFFIETPVFLGFSSLLKNQRYLR